MTGPLERAFERAQRQRGNDSTSLTALVNHKEAQNSTTVATNDDGSSAHTETQPRRRKRLQVSTLSDRYKATQWMVDHAQEHGDKHIASKCVKQFPGFFSGKPNANIMKAMRWWRDREKKLLG